MGPIQKMGGAGGWDQPLENSLRGYPLNYLGCNSYPIPKNRDCVQFGKNLW